MDGIVCVVSLHTAVHRYNTDDSVHRSVAVAARVLRFLLSVLLSLVHPRRTGVLIRRVIRIRCTSTSCTCSRRFFIIRRLFFNPCCATELRATFIITISVICVEAFVNLAISTAASLLRPSFRRSVALSRAPALYYYSVPVFYSSPRSVNVAPQHVAGRLSLDLYLVLRLSIRSSSSTCSRTAPSCLLRAPS